MKILIECFIPIESGPVLSFGIANALKDKGNDVFAILPQEVENKKNWDQLLGKERIFYIKTGLNLKKHFFNTFKTLLEIKKFFNGIVFDIYLDTFPNGDNRKISKFISYKRSFGIDHDVIPHSSTDKKDSDRVYKSLNSFDNIIVMSKSFISIAKKKYGYKKKVYYLKHGAMEYPALEDNFEFNNKFTINFLYFGRIDGYKGLHVLAKAYKNLSCKYNNISLTIAGNGDFSEYKDEYSNLKNCKIVNKYIEDKDIPYYFNRPKTVLVLPYLDATQSGVIGMAFNYRTPVIVSDTGGLKEQLFDGKLGLFVQSGSVDDLKEKMEMFLLDKKIYTSQVNLMEKGYQKSTWDYVVGEFLQQIEDDF